VAVGNVAAAEASRGGWKVEVVVVMVVVVVEAAPGPVGEPVSTLVHLL
jgi:hypothetical protein